MTLFNEMILDSNSLFLKKDFGWVIFYPKADRILLCNKINGYMVVSLGFANIKLTQHMSTHISEAFGEEDLAFLRERGDRSTPFVLPKRGKRHYTEVWAEEDGAMSIDSPQQGRDKLPPNQPRGSIENMNDSVGETDGLSIGPLASRLLGALRTENRTQVSDDKPATNGDVSMNGDADGDEQNGGAEDKSSPKPPATFMTESSTEAWKKTTHPNWSTPK